MSAPFFFCQLFRRKTSISTGGEFAELAVLRLGVALPADQKVRRMWSAIAKRFDCLGYFPKITVLEKCDAAAM